MIKYVELTAPNASAFRQAKILSIECQEGDEIKEGDTLFKVQSGSHQINLPAIRAGRIVEMIATVHENITLSTALLLLETKVSGSSANKSIADESPQVAPNKTTAKRREPTPLKASDKDANDKKQPQTKKQTPIANTKSPTKQKASKQNTGAVKKRHEQQSLNLNGAESGSKQHDGEHTEQTANETQREKQEVELTQVVTPPSSPAIQNTKKTSPTMTSSANKSSPSSIEISVPDIGADSAKVIEILVNVGDSVSIEDPLVTLESDKASMDVPSSHDGTIKSIAVSVDQDVSEGTLILELEIASESTAPAKSEPETKHADTEAPKTEKPSASSNVSAAIVDVTIPDIGGDSAKVIEILVKVGDSVDVEDALVTLESDKASMDVPSSAAGTIKSIEVSMDQDVSEGTIVVTLETSEESSGAVESTTPKVKSEKSEAVAAKPANSTPPVQANSSAPNKTSASAPSANQGSAHASPSIRRFARELGVDLTQLSGSGRKGRITKDDVKGYVKGALSKPTSPSAAASSGAGIPAIPAQDFSKFGEIDVQPLNKIKKLTASNLHRSWLNVPHVTHNDESNINDLEAFRKQLNAEYAKTKQDIKLSPLAFIVKAMVNALQRYPQFNSSLEPGGENLIFKKYFNIGIAVETPNGLVVPVLKDADKKSVAEIATEMGELAKKARDKKLTMNDMSGACITISSLGGIGGTGFTPIVNAPEVAILGVSRSKIQPVWNGKEFEPGMILPLSLSYDHRVIDGAEAARFTRHIAALLEDIRRLTV